MEARDEDRLRVAVGNTVRPVLQVLEEGVRTGTVRTRTKLRLSRIQTEDGSASLSQEEEIVPDLSPLTFPLLRVIEKLAGFATLAQLVQEDEFARVVLNAGGTPVTDPATRASWLAQDVVLRFIHYYLDLCPDGRWDESAFACIFQDLVGQVDGEPLVMRLLAPLDRFTSHVQRVTFDDRTAIRTLSNEEISELFDSFGANMHNATLDVFDLLNWTHAIEQTVEVAFPPRQEEYVRDVLTSLRLLRESAVRIPFVWHQHAGRSFAPGGHLSHSGLESGIRLGSDLELRDDDTADLAVVLAGLRSVQHSDSDTKRRFELARRRLDNAVERSSDEDRLIDYWVALETLFSYDARGEILYRARTRIAKYLASDLDGRAQLFASVGTSYKLRSAIVHGDKVAATLPEITRETGEILRRALRKMLEDGTALELDELDLS